MVQTTKQAFCWLTSKCWKKENVFSSLFGGSLIMGKGVGGFIFWFRVEKVFSGLNNLYNVSGES